MAVHIFCVGLADCLRRLIGGGDLFFCQKGFITLGNAVDGARVDPVDERIRAVMVIGILPGNLRFSHPAHAI